MLSRKTLSLLLLGALTWFLFVSSSNALPTGTLGIDLVSRDPQKGKKGGSKAPPPAAPAPPPPAAAPPAPAPPPPAPAPPPPAHEPKPPAPAPPPPPPAPEPKPAAPAPPPPPPANQAPPPPPPANQAPPAAPPANQAPAAPPANQGAPPAAPSPKPDPAQPAATVKPDPAQPATVAPADTANTANPPAQSAPPAAASPATSFSKKARSSRPTPTPSPLPDLPKNKAELVNKFFLRAPRKDKSCFFTGMDITVNLKATPAANTVLAKQKCRKAGLTTLEEIWKNKQLLNQGQWNRASFNNNDFKKFIVWVSEVFAEKTTGTAFLLISETTQPTAGSIFFANEFDKMKASGDVDKIERMNFTEADDAVVASTWWTKGDPNPPTRESAALAAVAAAAPAAPVAPGP